MSGPRAAARASLIAVILLATSACSTDTAAPSSILSDDVVTLGSFDFPESALLAEIYAQALERAGFDVQRRFEVGPREVLLPALQNGLIELVPEYQGSALAFQGGTPTADPIATQLELARVFTEVGLEVLEPTPAENANTFVVTRATAERFDLEAVSDLQGADTGLRFGGPPECPDRPLCLGGLEDLYGLRFASFVPLDAGGPLTIQALRDGIVDVALLFTSSDVLADGDLIALRDDRGLQPAEHIVPVIRPEILSLGPVSEVLNEVSASLSTEDLRRMNGEVVAGTPVATVAGAWLAGADAPSTPV